MPPTHLNPTGLIPIFKKKAASSALRDDARGQSGKKRLPLFYVHLLMLAAALLVSTSFIVGAAIADAMDPVHLTLARFLLAVLVFAPWICHRYGLRVSWSLFWRSSVISLCLVVFFCCMFLSLRYTTALNTSVIFALVPSISFVYSFFIVGERLTKEQLVALLFGLFGVLWVVFRGDMSLLLTLQWNIGDLIFLGGCVVLGLYTPLVRLLHRQESMALMTFWVLVTGSLWLLLYSTLRIVPMELGEVPARVWLGISYLAVFTTVITFFLTQYSVLYLGPTKVSAYSYLYPGLVLILDLLLGHGLPPTKILPGVFLVPLAMVVLMVARERS